MLIHWAKLMYWGNLVYLFTEVSVCTYLLRSVNISFTEVSYCTHLLSE